MPNFKTKFYTDFCCAGANNAHYVLKLKIDRVVFVALKTAIKIHNHHDVYAALRGRVQFALYYFFSVI